MSQTTDEITMRPATRADLDEWYGSEFKRSCRAWIIERNSVAAAIAGYSFEPGYILVFSEMRDHGASKFAIWRHAIRAFEQIQQYGLPMVAVADPAVVGSAQFLKRLGFKFDRNSDAGEIYIWHRH